MQGAAQATATADVAASIKRPAFFADEEAFRPGGPVQHTPPRSPVQREVFADDYDEAEEAVETDDGQTAGDEEDDVEEE